jgi:hypothetical protein
MELPEIEYTLDKEQPLLLAFDIGADGTLPRSDQIVPEADATAYLGPPPPDPQGPPIYEAGIADRRSGYVSERRIYLVPQIDALGDWD